MDAHLLGILERAGDRLVKLTGELRGSPGVPIRMAEEAAAVTQVVLLVENEVKTRMGLDGADGGEQPGEGG